MIAPGSGTVMFGLPSIIDIPDAVLWRDYLASLWSQQVSDLPPARRLQGHQVEGLVDRLTLSKRWFNPVASSRKLRELVSTAPSVGDPPFGATPATLDLGEGRRLITPEGIAILWLLERATDGLGGADAYPIAISTADLTTAMAAVAEVYRSWVQPRISAVAALLREETSTLRPTAAGLLFFLLLNRHTAADRPLLRPRDPARANAVNDAIGSTVLEFAQLVGGSSKASTSGFDVYRGWAYGEIARRLGTAWGENRTGVWIQPAGAAPATSRLVSASRAALATEPADALAQLRAVTATFDAARPRLAALGMAFERPANTETLITALSGAVPPSRRRA